MKKATDDILKKSKLVDFLIVVLDARVPLSSLNSSLLDKLKNKRKLYILNKADLADISETDKWVKHFQDEGDFCIAINLKDNKSDRDLIGIFENMYAIKREKALRKGMANVVNRAMIIGIPNVGKSTLINLLAKKSLQKVENSPGVTKKATWFKVDEHLEMIDTPGILQPQFEDKTKALNLALIGSIKETILPSRELSEACLDFLLKYYPRDLIKRYDLADLNMSKEQLLIEIAKRRGLLVKGGGFDIEKASILLLNEFKSGSLGRFTLDRI
jgi:ribosome biogenesis GTPase A